MRIKALQDFRFFNNDYGNVEVSKDQELEVKDELAKDFIRMSLAEEVKVRNKKYKEGD